MSNIRDSVLILNSRNDDVTQLRIYFFGLFVRSQMDVNGGNTVKKSQKETHVHEHTTVAPWQLVVSLENK